MTSSEQGGAGVVTVIEFTDPGCVWSWSSEPTLRWLRHRYGDRLRWRRVLGVQIDALERTHPGADPVASAEDFRARWLEVAAHTGAPITERLEWIHHSTRPAAQAARAAEQQGPAVAEAVLRRLREAVFVAGRPADTTDRIAEALAGVPGLDLDRLLADRAGGAVARSLAVDWDETRRPRPEVHGLTGPGPHPGAATRHGNRLRYSFPTLILRGPAGDRVVPGWRPPATHRAAIEAVAPDLAFVDERPLDGGVALERYRSLSARDLELLSGSPEAPPRAVRVETATTALWIHPDEASDRRPLAAEGAPG
ncbi:MAG: hypothetical protein JWN32_2696 [Solirubrobacterales bacterium]|nr:hypothetical protein [Solirubrobacterales bacterium]